MRNRYNYPGVIDDGAGIRFDTSPSKPVSSFSMEMRVGQILVLLRRNALSHATIKHMSA